MEKEVILHAFRFYRQNQTHTADGLGIAIRTLDSKLERYGIITKSETADEAPVPEAEPGLCVESRREAPEERAMPVRKRQKV